MTLALKKYLKYLLVATTFFIAIGLIPSVQADTLKVGIVKKAPNYIKKDGHLSGFDVELAHKIGKQLNKSIKIKTYSSQQQLINATKQHKVDLGLSIPKSATHSLHQSEPELYIKNVLFGQKNYSVKTLKNQPVGVLKNHFQASLINSLGMKAVTFSSTDSLITALKKGKIKAALLNQYQFNNYLTHHVNYDQLQNGNDHAEFKKIADVNITAEQIVAISTNAKTTSQVSKALHDLRINGELTALSAKYYKHNYAYQ